MKRILIFALPMVLLVHAEFASGQETHDFDVIGGEGGAIVIESVQDSDGVLSNRMQIMAVDPADMDQAIFMGDGPLQFGMSEGDSFSMLSNPSVQKDLELVDDQLKRIKDINEEFSKQMHDQMKGMHGEDGSYAMDRAKELGQLIRDLKERQKEELNNILLPQQQDRLKQVALQMQMKNRGTAGVLADKLAKELGITGDQSKRIKERQKQLQKDIEEKIAKLREEARESLLEELTKDQRKKFDELTGVKFESKTEDFQSKFRRLKSRSGDRIDF